MYTLRNILLVLVGSSSYFIDKIKIEMKWNETKEVKQWLILWRSLLVFQFLSFRLSSLLHPLLLPLLSTLLVSAVHQSTELLIVQLLVSRDVKLLECNLNLLCWQCFTKWSEFLKEEISIVLKVIKIISTSFDTFPFLSMSIMKKAFSVLVCSPQNSSQDSFPSRSLSFSWNIGLLK